HHPCVRTWLLLEEEAKLRAREGGMRNDVRSGRAVLCHLAREAAPPARAGSFDGEIASRESERRARMERAPCDPAIGARDRIETERREEIEGAHRSAVVVAGQAIRAVAVVHQRRIAR